jgi:hypothetical protein
MGALRAKMEQDLLIRGLSPNTQEAYLRAVVGLTKYYGRAPDTLSAQEAQTYLAYLVKERGLAWSSLSVTVHGLRFFYEVTLGRPRTRFYLPTVKTPATQPEILSRQEIARLLAAVANRKHRTLLMATYAAGLRVSEVLKLKVGDIDSERMAIRVAQGKGRKDLTPCSPRGCWRSCAATGGCTGPRPGCFRPAIPSTRSRAPPPTASIMSPKAARGSAKPAVSTACAMPLLRISWKLVLTYRPSNPCWATIVSARPAAISILSTAGEPSGARPSIS